MREVPAKLFGFMCVACARAGADVEAAQRGLALRHVDVDTPGQRVDWDEVATFLQRTLGHRSRAEMEAVGEVYTETHLLMRLVARVVLTPRTLYQLCFGPLMRASFPHLESVAEPNEHGVHVELRLPEGFQPSPPFFHGTTGELRAMTTVLGRPPAEVEADVGPRHGVWDVHLGARMPADRTIEGLDFVASEAVAMIRRAVSADRLGEVDAARATQVLDLQRRFGLSLSEARVASRLASGASPREIAAELGVRLSTVRSHLKSAYLKTGARGQTDLVRVVLTQSTRGRNG